jgi:pilin isopeptide linkage protein
MRINHARGPKAALAALSLLMLLALLSFPAFAAENFAELDIPVYKQLSGDTPSSDARFAFTLTALDGAPMPDGSANGVKTASLSGSGSVSFGPIRFSQLGEYHYTIRETDAGEPRYTYDKTVYSATVLVSWKGAVGGQLAATLYLSKGDGVYKQPQALFTNRYTRPEPAVVDPGISKTVQGNPPADALFSFRLAADSASFPMPSGSVNGEKIIYLTGPGQAEFGNIAFTEPGTYTYTVREIDGSLSGYAYDTTVYAMTVTVTESDGKLSAVRRIERADGTPATSLDFTNVYRNPVQPGGGNPVQPGGGNPHPAGPSLPYTGDSSNGILWGVLFLLSAAAVFVIILLKNKDSKKDSE